MLFLNKRLSLNIGTLFIVFVFLLSGLATNNSAQTKTAKKADSAAAKKPTPIPKKNDKAATAKTSKTTPTKNSIAKKSVVKSSTDKKSVDKKTTKTAAGKSESTKKPAAKTAVKMPVKTTAKISAKSSKPDPQTKSDSKSNISANSPKSSKKISEPAKQAAKTVSKTSANITKASGVKASVISKMPENSQAIVAVTAARIRTEPSTNAAEVRRVKLGTLVKVLEENPTWYKVQFADSSKQSGWISKQLTNNFEENRREEIYRQIADRHFKTDKPAFGDAAEIYEFLTRAEDEIKTPALSSELGFKRLLTLRAALKAIPFGKASEKPYSDFLKTNNKTIVYSEPAGEWYVRSELFWDLRKKYSKEPIAEEVAWTAAQNPLPGECEGYINCYLFVLRETDGEYLTLYPNSKHSEQSLKNIQNLLDPIAADSAEKKIYTGPSDVSDRAEFNKLIAELRTVVSKLPFAELEKQKTIQQLNKIAEGFR